MCQYAISLTYTASSVTKRFPVVNAETMMWSASRDSEKRRNISNFLRGMFIFGRRILPSSPDGNFTNAPRKRYAEVLLSTRFALVAVVRELYTMIRNSQPWELGEPKLNDRGQPAIHDIASKLGCIQSNNGLVSWAFPEDNQELVSLIARYRRPVIGGGNSSAITLSPQSLTCNNFDPSGSYAAMPSPTIPSSAVAATTVTTASSSAWMGLQLAQQSGAFMNMGLLNQGLLEPNGTIEWHMLSCPNPEVMIGMGDPMIYPGYDAETLRM